MSATAQQKEKAILFGVRNARLITDAGKTIQVLELL